MRHLVPTRHTIRCPLNGSTAIVTARTDARRPSRRHRDVATCSLLPSTAFVAPARVGYFSDLAPPVAYVRDVDSVPRHSAAFGCAKRCLGVLNGAEPRPVEPVPCASGVCDALELARRTQSPEIMRLLWTSAG